MFGGEQIVSTYSDCTRAQDFCYPERSPDTWLIASSGIPSTRARAPLQVDLRSLIRNELFVGMQDQLLQPPVVHVRDVQCILIGTGDAVNPVELPAIAT
jgi:hypothetical protein